MCRTCAVSMFLQMLEVGGNVLDTLSIGVRAALQSTLIPKLTVTGEGEEMEIQVSDNPHHSSPVHAEGAPIIITLHQVILSSCGLRSCEGVAMGVRGVVITLGWWSVCGGLCCGGGAV